MPRVRNLVIATALAGLAATLFVSVLPFLRFAYRSPATHVSIESAASVIALLVAYLMWGRYRSTGTWRDLGLVVALTVIGATNLGFSVVPALAGGGPGGFATWAPVGGRALGSALLAAAAFAPGGHLAHPRRRGALGVLGALFALGVIAALAAALGDHLPPAIEADISPESSGRPRIVGNAGVLAIQGLTTVLYGAAAFGFARRAARTGDELTGWIAVAATLGAFARVNYFLFPSLYSEWVYTGDALRLASFLALLVGMVREITVYQRGLSRAAAAEERRRIARDLHDGLSQELAFLYTAAKRAARGEPAAEELERIEAAAARALDESRAAIAVLTRPLDESLHVAIAQAAEDTGLRAGLRVRLRLDEGIEAAPDVREMLARIVREAVTNAARHSEAEEVAVSLDGGDGIRLVVEDAGRGFDPLAVDGGFGLTSMRERAVAAGAAFSIDARPGGGTRIEVHVP